MNDPTTLTPVWLQVTMSILLLLERIAYYLYQVLIKKDVKCNSCCGLFTADMTDSEREEKPETGEGKDEIQDNVKE